MINVNIFAKKWHIVLLLSFFLFLSCSKEVFVEQAADLSENSCRIYINSNPAGAKIYIGNKNTGYVTPDTIRWLEEKDYLITLKRDYFWDTSFTISAGKWAVSDTNINYYENERMLGRLYCYSSPTGAKIYVNDELIEEITPVTLTRLIPGVYKIKYEYPEYRTDSTEAKVKSNKLTIASIKLDDTLDVITYTKANSGIPSDIITGIAEDKEGNIWMGTGSAGLLKYDGKKFYNYTKSNSSFVKSDYVKCIESDSENNIYVGFASAISRYDGKNWDSFESKAVMMIQIMNDDKMIATTNDGGLIKYSGGIWEVFTKANGGLPDDDIIAACIDQEGKIWGTIRTGGITVYSGNKWAVQDSAGYNFPASLCCGINMSKSGDIIGIFYNPPADGRISYAKHYIALFTGGKWEVIYTINYSWLQDKEMYFDESDKLWFTYGNIYSNIGRISLKTYSYESFDNILKSGIRKFQTWGASDLYNYFQGRNIFIDSKQNLWFYGDKGAINIKSGSWNN